MASKKVVEVLCPNGRRQKVKADANSTILQILEEVCTKQGFDSNEYDLRHQRTILDVTSVVRLANVPNNAKLEMVSRKVPRKASSVIVAIQLETGERLQHSFPSSATLSDVLQQMENKPDSPHKGKLICKTPVIIYMTKEICGVRALESTTLKSLGLIGGRAILRLIHRDVDPAVDSSSGEAVRSTKSSESETESRPQVTNYLSNTEPSKDQPQKEDITKVIKIVADASSDSSCNRVKNDKSSQSTSQDIVTGDSSGRLVGERRGSTERSPEKGPEQKKPKLQDEADTTKSSARNPVLNSSSSVTLVPFKDFRFPESTIGQDLYKVEAVDPQRLKTEMKLSMPCDRRQLVYRLDEVESRIGEIADPSDDFFEVTIEDVRKMIQDLQYDRKQLEDAPLLTKAGKAERDLEKLTNYKQVVIRVHFPDKYVLQGFFRPLEKVSAVTQFVRSCLEDDKDKFYLYTTPPKTVLKNKDLTLNEAKLIPAAIVHFSSQTEKDHWLKDELLTDAVKYRDAEIAVYNALKSNTQGTNAVETHTSISKNESTQVAQQQPPGPQNSQERSQPRQTRNDSSSTGGQKKPMPKWLKLGK